MSKAINPVSVAIQANEPVIVWGEPGTGKTTVMTSIAKQLNRHIETVIASIREPSDFGGQPFVSNADTVKLATPAWAQRAIDAKNPIVFFDEGNRATPAVQNAMLRVVLDKVVGDTVLPAHTAMVLAANPPDTDGGISDLSAPLANRLCHLDWGFSHSMWIDGLLTGFDTPRVPIVPENWQGGIASQRILVAGFNKAKTQAALIVPKTDAERGKAWPSPRSWDMAARLRAAAMAANAGKDVEIQLTVGCVGQMGIEFLNWVEAMDLPDPEELLKAPKSFVVPERGDRTFTILASVAAAAVTKPTKERYLAAWHIFNAATKGGHKDVAAASVIHLVRGFTTKAFLADKDVRESVREHLQPFVAILQQAGLLREAK